MGALFRHRGTSSARISSLERNMCKLNLFVKLSMTDKRGYFHNRSLQTGV